MVKCNIQICHIILYVVNTEVLNILPPSSNRCPSTGFKTTRSFFHHKRLAWPMCGYVCFVELELGPILRQLGVISSFAVSRTVVHEIICLCVIV